MKTVKRRKFHINGGFYYTFPNYITDSQILACMSILQHAVELGPNEKPLINDPIGITFKIEIGYEEEFFDNWYIPNFVKRALSWICSSISKDKFSSHIM